MNPAPDTLLPVAASVALHGWSMATAAAVSAACALVGSFLVVRRMSLLGDAIAHAVLPGIAVAVLAGGRLGGPVVLADVAVRAGRVDEAARELERGRAAEARATAAAPRQ